jgi:biopolymer transport protein ExbD
MAAQARTQAASSAPNIQITADPATPFNETVKVMEAAQKAGMRAIKVMPSGVVLDTPQPPPPGLPPPGMAPPRPAPAVSNVAIIERMKPDPTATPKSTAPPVPVPYPIPDPVRVFVDFDGGVFVNGVWQSPADLEKAFKGFAAMKTQPEIHIEVHARTTYARVEQVIAMADKAGLRLFGLVQDII